MKWGESKRAFAGFLAAAHVISVGVPAAAASPERRRLLLPDVVRTSDGENLRIVPPAFAARHPDLLAALSTNDVRIQRVTLPARADAPVVIHVQDIHLDAGAQTRISRTIQSLLAAGAPIRVIGLEGAFAEIPLDRFRLHADPEDLREAADYLLTEKQISGPIHAALAAPGEIPPVQGIDDAGLYWTNIRDYRSAAPQATAAKAAVAAWRADVERRKASDFNEALRAFDQSVQEYRAGRRSLADHAQDLGDAGSPHLHRFLQALAQERALDFKRVSAARDGFIKTLTVRLPEARLREVADKALEYRAGRLGHSAFYDFLEAVGGEMPPALSAYARYLRLSASVQPQALLLEMAARTKAGYARLAATPAERALAAESEALSLTEKLLDFSLMPAEWAAYQETSRRGLVRLSVDLSPFTSFYIHAQARDAAMADRFLDVLDANAGAGAAVLVTGGFHAPGLTERLTAAGCAVMSLAPAVDDAGEAGESLSIFKRAKTPLDDLFPGEAAALSPEPFTHRAAAFLTTVLLALNQLKGRTPEAAAFARRLLPAVRDARVEAAKNRIEVTLKLRGGLLSAVFNKDKDRLSPVPDIKVNGKNTPSIRQAGSVFGDFATALQSRVWAILFAAPILVGCAQTFLAGGFNLFSSRVDIPIKHVAAIPEGSEEPDAMDIAWRYPKFAQALSAYGESRVRQMEGTTWDFLMDPREHEMAKLSYRLLVSHDREINDESLIDALNYFQAAEGAFNKKIVLGPGTFAMNIVGPEFFEGMLPAMHELEDAAGAEHADYYGLDGWWQALDDIAAEKRPIFITFFTHGFPNAMDFTGYGSASKNTFKGNGPNIRAMGQLIDALRERGRPDVFILNNNCFSADYNWRLAFLLEQENIPALGLMSSTDFNSFAHITRSYFDSSKDVKISYSSPLLERLTFYAKEHHRLTGEHVIGVSRMAMRDEPTLFIPEQKGVPHFPRGGVRRLVYPVNKNLSSDLENFMQEAGHESSRRANPFFFPLGPLNEWAELGLIPARAQARLPGFMAALKHRLGPLGVLKFYRWVGVVWTENLPDLLPMGASLAAVWLGASPMEIMGTFLATFALARGFFIASHPSGRRAGAWTVSLLGAGAVAALFSVAHWPLAAALPAAWAAHVIWNFAGDMLRPEAVVHAEYAAMALSLAASDPTSAAQALDGLAGGLDARTLNRSARVFGFTPDPSLLNTTRVRIVAVDAADVQGGADKILDALSAGRREENPVVFTSDDPEALDKLARALAAAPRPGASVRGTEDLFKDGRFLRHAALAPLVAGGGTVEIVASERYASDLTGAAGVLAFADIRKPLESFVKLIEFLKRVDELIRTQA